MSDKPYTYVDRFGAGIGITDSKDDAILLQVFAAGSDKWLGIEIPDSERRKLSNAISDSYERAIVRVLNVLRGHVRVDGANIVVPYAELMAAIYIDPQRQKITPGLEARAKEIEFILLNPETGDGAGVDQVADAAADEEPPGSGGETAPSSPKEV